MTTNHSYELSLRWTGNHGQGTTGYLAYGRDHEVHGVDKPMIPGSSDAAFRGDRRRWNPEELLVASLSQCHLLWYLHLAAEAGIVVTSYSDTPTGLMAEERGGAGRFTQVVLRPVVTVSQAHMCPRAQALHHDVAAKCFISRSVNFPVHHEPVTRVDDGS
jgi:organic hydroperoxide reductase OsmC/OhrA